MNSAYYLLFVLIASITFIVWATAHMKMNAFFVLITAAFGVGLLSGMGPENIIVVLKKGFGQTMGKIGLVIIFGTALGILLEKTGATLSMANSILKKVGESNAPIAISISGFIIGFPIFCDSAFIILNGLNHSLVKKTGHRMPVMAASLATSLYAVHCLVPPHPGITAAVAAAGGDVGHVMVWGLVLALPAALIGYCWSVWRGNKVSYSYMEVEATTTPGKKLPPPSLAFLPIIFPIVLISSKSIMMLCCLPKDIAANKFLQTISFLGEPIIALASGLLISLLLIQKQNKKHVAQWLTEGVDRAGMILAIVAAGGMYGEVLEATGMAKSLGEILSRYALGIFFPFAMAAILKTAQGSSTVAVIAASALVTPLLGKMGLSSGIGITMTVLSMGAGSMVVSHANDAYFWVISRFSNLDTESTLKVYSVATLLMGIVTQILIWIIFAFYK